jgi:hypothetical protein
LNKLSIPSRTSFEPTSVDSVVPTASSQDTVTPNVIESSTRNLNNISIPSRTSFEPTSVDTVAPINKVRPSNNSTRRVSLLRNIRKAATPIPAPAKRGPLPVNEHPDKYYPLPGFR